MQINKIHLHAHYKPAIIQIMKKNRRLFFLVILFALLIHALLFLLILGSRFISKTKTLPKPEREIIIERTPPPAAQPMPPAEQAQDLPTMLPGKLEQPANDLKQDSEAPTEPQKESKPTRSPQTQEIAEPIPTPIKEPEKILDLDALAPKEAELKEKVTKLDTSTAPKPVAARKRARKPTFNFNQLNEYATALGNSAFKNQGVD